MEAVLGYASVRTYERDTASPHQNRVACYPCWCIAVLVAWTEPVDAVVLVLVFVPPGHAYMPCPCLRAPVPVHHDLHRPVPAVGRREVHARRGTQPDPTDRRATPHCHRQCSSSTYYHHHHRCRHPVSPSTNMAECQDDIGLRGRRSCCSTQPAADCLRRRLRRRRVCSGAPQLLYLSLSRQPDRPFATSQR